MPVEHTGARVDPSWMLQAGAGATRPVTSHRAARGGARRRRAEPPAGALARPLRPSTTDSASIPAAHVHGRPRAPRPASHAPVSRRGEFFTVLARSWRRGGARSPFPSTRPAARSRARFVRTRLRPRLPHSPPWRRAKASRKSSDPCFRRSRRLDGRSRQKKGRGVVFRGITATQARFWVD